MLMDNSRNQSEQNTWRRGEKYNPAFERHWKSSPCWPANKEKIDCSGQRKSEPIVTWIPGQRRLKNHFTV
ncbi:hypothetical protein Y1Q_0007513 [Alligator mississippiensis]|uniref:Uncharacterized protein n=1 Tax=Alligator mississippiensis TaxID=8496 RepID=A0A151M542_ALLMI|nr:hypothetical protein Y1Q_0007513 [Alligator mississippiensis]